MDHLAIISRDDFLEHYDLAKMEEAAVYKLSSYDGYDADLWERFEKLRDFYRMVLNHNEGVLVFTY